jgi:hypothetical protein
MKYLSLYSLSWDAFAYAFPGKDYGTIYGYALVRENAKPVYYDDAKTQLAYYEYSGRPLVNSNGEYIRSGQRTPLGNIYPDWFGGVTNTFNYKKLSLSILVDFKKGGKIFSETHMFSEYTGVLANTAAINANGKNVRDALADGGGVLVSDAVYGKVNAQTGAITFLDATGAASDVPVTNTTYVDANTFYYDYYKLHELSIFDASYTKLREVSLSYSFDKISFLNKIGIKDLNISAVGRNLWIIHKNIPDVDPEVGNSAGNTSVGAEQNAIPSTRSYGFNIKISF